jgi:hypothetical protein
MDLLVLQLPYRRATKTLSNQRPRPSMLIPHFQHIGECRAGELRPWYVLKTSGRPLPNASSSASRQNEVSRYSIDVTPVPVLDPGRARTKTGWLWSYARDDGRGRVHCRLPSPMFTARTDKPRFRRATSLLSPGCCRSTAMPGSKRWPRSRKSARRADCCRGAAADRRTLPDRGAHSQPSARAARPDPPSRAAAAGRSHEDMA